GRLHQRVGRVDHVVHDDAGPAVDIADDVHDFGDVRLRAPLVDDRQVGVEPLGKRPGAHHATHVGGHDHDVLELLLVDVGQQQRRRVHVVDGDVEETLDLVGVQVHREDPVDAGGLQHVG